MANRSYVYTADSVPTAGHHPSPTRGLTEWNWGIPLTHKILASASPRRCTSVLWRDRSIGIAADAEEGKRRLLSFLELIGRTGAIPDMKTFQAAVAKTRRALTDPRHAGAFVLLEAGEIYMMEDGDLETHIEGFVTELQKLGGNLERADVVEDSVWLRAIARGWEEDLGGLYWSSLLACDPNTAS
jgi:hypothetical protein